MASIPGFSEEELELINSGQMSASKRCMASTGTTDGGHCWCVLKYGHVGPHWNQHAQLTWRGGEPVPGGYRATDIECCEHYCAEIEETLAWFDRVNPG